MVVKLKKGYVKRVQAKHRSAGVKALSLVKSLRRETRPEMKVFKTSGADNMNTTGLTTVLFNPSQGDTYQTRSGLVVRPRTLTLRAVAQLNGSGQLARCRVLIVKGNKENGGTPNLGDILDTVSSISMRNYPLLKKNTVIYDRAFILQNTGSVAGVDAAQFIKTIRLSGPTTFTSDSTTNENHGYYIMVLSDQTTNVPVFSWNVQITFTDV